ncbi:hypothetical protein B879_04218 [Cecembia lonarensis LW9]|uniref:Uncharacterized protein n=1 Tax=Cecembia lonarensis (strain CCUG 58316 / KCTC 22772 / LW9) TaxID=1225176 RepID=K1LSV9_CECL9|nr:hypothetical protein B879_04218 [Cecembia lonarensis LW9]
MRGFRRSAPDVGGEGGYPAPWGHCRGLRAAARWCFNILAFPRRSELDCYRHRDHGLRWAHRCWPPLLHARTRARASDGRSSISPTPLRARTRVGPFNPPRWDQGVRPPPECRMGLRGLHLHYHFRQRTRDW